MISMHDGKITKIGPAPERTLALEQLARLPGGEVQHGFRAVQSASDAPPCLQEKRTERQKQYQKRFGRARWETLVKKAWEHFAWEMRMHVIVPFKQERKALRGKMLQFVKRVFFDWQKTHCCTLRKEPEPTAAILYGLTVSDYEDSSEEEQDLQEEEVFGPSSFGEFDDDEAAEECERQVQQAIEISLKELDTPSPVAFVSSRLLPVASPSSLSPSAPLFNPTSATERDALPTPTHTPRQRQALINRSIPG